MKQFFLLLLLSVFSLAAADFTVPRHTSWVVDEAQVFSKEERNRILSAIQKLEKATDGGKIKNNSEILPKTVDKRGVI